jgi:hypothetical protein
LAWRNVRRVLNDQTRQAMHSKSRTARKKTGSQAQALHPGFSALARLLARDLARQHFENPLSPSQDGAYAANSPSADTPEDTS